MLQITLDVTDFISAVKKRNVLFYPAMMHILLSACSQKEDSFFYEFEEGKFLKTNFHSDFNEFYKNYIYACYIQEEQKEIIKNKIVFALHKKSISNADFILLPFEESQNRTFMNIIVNFSVPTDFQMRCQQAVLNF